MTREEIHDALIAGQQAAGDVLRERGIDPRLVVIHAVAEGSQLGLEVPPGGELYLTFAQHPTRDVLAELEDGMPIAQSLAGSMRETANRLWPPPEITAPPPSPPPAPTRGETPIRTPNSTATSEVRRERRKRG